MAKLQSRVPLGASDMDKALSAAAAAFQGAAANPRAAVYIGKGTSLANILATARFDQLVGALADNHIPVSSLAIGPRLDMPLLSALAGRTGGKVISDAPAGPPAGAELLLRRAMSRALAAGGHLPRGVHRGLPQTHSALAAGPRIGRGGLLSGRGPLRRADDRCRTERAADVELEGRRGRFPAGQRLSQPTGATRPRGRRREPAAGRLGEPGGGRHGGGHLRDNSTELARQALASGNLGAAEKLAASAVEQEPTDRAAKDLLAQIAAARKAKGGAANPANIELVAAGNPVDNQSPPPPGNPPDQSNGEARSPRAWSIKPACFRR